MKKELIFIVNDDREKQQQLVECFKETYSIITACDGSEAISKLEMHFTEIVIILLDISMSVTKGFEVINWLKTNNYSHIPVIVMTDETKAQAEALNQGAYSVAPENVNDDVIKAMVDSAVSHCNKKNTEMQNIVKSLPGGIATYRIVDNRFEMLSFSDGVAMLTGHTRQEYIDRVGDDSSKIIYEEDRKRLMKAAIDNLKKGMPIDETYRVYHKNGSLVWVRITAAMVDNSDDNPVMQAVFQRPSRMTQLYDNLVNESKNLIYVSDIHNYDMLYINNTALKELGKEREDYSQKKCYEFLFGFTEPCPFCTISKMNSESYLQREFTYPFNNKKYAMRGKLTDWNGISAHVEYLQDITEERKIQRKNGDLLRQLQSLMENIPGGVCVYRISGNDIKPMLHNQAFFDIFGFTDEHHRDVINETHFLNVHPDDVECLRTAISDAVRNDGKIDCTYRAFHDGKGCYIWINMKAIVIKQFDGEKLCYVCYNDVTNERIAQEQLVDAQHELQENQLRYETAIRSSGINIWEYDIQNDSLYVVSNSARIKQNCFRIEHYVESTINNKFIREDSIPEFLHIFERLRNGEPTVTADIWYKTTDEAGWWCERVTYTSAFDESGQPIKAYGAGRDVTREKIAEQKFHEELVYRKAFQHENFASILVDLTDNKVLEADSQFETIQAHVGTTGDQYFEKTKEMVTGEDNKKKYSKAYNRKKLLNDFSNGEYSKAMELTRMYDNNTVFWIKYNVHLIQNPDTKHIMAHFTCIDVTNEKVMQTIMETVAKTDYERFTVVDGLTDSARDYGIPEEKRAFQSEKSFEEQNEKLIRKVVCEEDIDRVMKECKIVNVWNHIKDGDVYKFSFNMRMPNGKIRHKQMQFTKIGAMRKTYLVSLMDVNNIYEEQELAKKKLQKALLDAEQANRAKTEFLSRVSHDIRTPMNAVISLSSLGQESTQLSETIDYLKKIESSGKYLLSIINDVLNLSKMEQKGIVLHPQAVYMPAFVKETIEIVMPTAKEKNINLKVTKKGIDCTYIKIDTTYARQVAINLLSNAIKFTGEGGTVEVILDNVSQNGKFIKNRLIVKDNGVGIDAEFLPKLFAPFEQENTKNDLSRQGTGLGLSIVKEIVRQMKGKIWVESVKGCGSTFYVEWDLETALESEYTEGQNIKQEVDISILDGKRILLVEDHPLNAEIATKLLGKKNIVVDYAENGKVAVDKFIQSQKEFYDAILMDIRMPIMDGIQAAKEIRKLDRADAKTTPIVAMTANAFDDDVTTAIEAGMNAHLAKPIEPGKLYETLALYIANH